MSATIPESHLDLLTGPVVVTLVTMMPDGQPHATPVWTTFDGTHLIVNTVRGRLKDRNMQANPRVTILAVDPEDDQRYVQVQGLVAEATEEGAAESMDALSQIYAGQVFYGGYAPAERINQETRVIYRVRPTRVIVQG